MSSDQFYIGSSINIFKRWKRHISQLKNKTHANIKLQKIYNEKGLDNLKFEIIEICDNLKEREQFYLDSLRPEININRFSSGGDMISNHPFKNILKKRQAEATRRVAQSKFMRKKRSENAKKLYPEGPMKGKKHSENTKQLFRKIRGKKVLIDDTIYNSLREAAEKLNTNHHTISDRAKSEKFPNYKFI